MFFRSLNVCFCEMGLYVIVNFYPSQALNIGLSMGFVGFILCLSNLSGLIISLFYSKLVCKFHRWVRCFRITSNIILIFSCIHLFMFANH